MVTPRSKLADYYAGRRVLDVERAAGAVKLAPLAYRPVIYIYQLEWANIPFYVGTTADPLSRLHNHMSETWRDRVAPCTIGLHHPLSFNHVSRAARVAAGSSTATNEVARVRTRAIEEHYAALLDIEKPA